MQTAGKAHDAFGLIVAGGRSRRFGSDKTRYSVDGRSMASRVHAAMSEVVEPVWLGLATAEHPVLPLPVILDEPSGIGPIGSLGPALASAPAAWMLTVAADLPDVTAADLARLLGARRAQVQAIVARDARGGLHPLCACYHVDAMDAVREQVASGRYAMHALLDRLSYETVILSDQALRNVNHPDDLRPNSANPL